MYGQCGRSDGEKGFVFECYRSTLNEMIVQFNIPIVNQ